jgi:deoxyribodipyrimidine photo-lyase
MKERKEGQIGILWYRQDLRLTDNEALVDALMRSDLLYPVYVFDERVFRGTTEYGFPKTGGHRATFIRESIEDLRSSLQRLGADLIIRQGKPEEEVFELARQLKADWVFCNRERTSEEVFVQDELEKRLWTIGVELRFNRGKMLYYTQDLPFPITHTPDTFTQFRKEVEKLVPVRLPLSEPDYIPWREPACEIGEVPPPSWFAQQDEGGVANDVFEYKGGEQTGWERLRYYFGDKKLASSYKETRNQMLGADFSTRFSAWLSAGCLSPKSIYHELKAYDENHGASDGTYHIFFELLWRDYFRLVAKKYGNLIFMPSGIKGTPAVSSMSKDAALFDRWASGQTGTPIIDACMKELRYTGFMSNRGRQLVASYLIKDLGIHWQMGASWFESQLIDYDPCSNWGNWMYIAGVGNDPRENRYFNILSQAKRYDPDGTFCFHWLPPLSQVPLDKIHLMDQLPTEEYAALGLKDAELYRNPLIPSSHWSN